MAVKLSIFTTITDPRIRGDNWKSAFRCFEVLADELVIVDGSSSMSPDSGFSHPDMKVIVSKWPQEFTWEFIGKQFQRGYEACTGDAVIHADIDFLFHDKDFEAIRLAAKKMLDEHLPAMSFYKYQFILPDRYNLKSRLVIMVNKRDFGERIKFNSGGDLAQPSLDGEYLNPNVVMESGIPFYNYEKILKTEDQIAKDQGRMERAYFRRFGKYQMGSDGTDENALAKWVAAQYGKLNKPHKHIKLEEHPIWIQDVIKNLNSRQWGYSAFKWGENDYVKGR